VAILELAADARTDSLLAATVYPAQQSFDYAFSHLTIEVCTERQADVELFCAALDICRYSRRGWEPIFLLTSRAFANPACSAT